MAKLGGEKGKASMPGWQEALHKPCISKKEEEGDERNKKGVWSGSQPISKQKRKKSRNPSPNRKNATTNNGKICIAQQ